ncbi:MAG: ATP-binding protein, partial [Planctomycetaceae bacterium]
ESRSSGGAGLGLSIAQSIIRAHHGESSLTSQPGHGTVVTVRLPQATGSVSADPGRRQPEPASSERELAAADA